MGIYERFGELPAAEITEEVNEALAHCSRLVITAPPGAGKSTLLPLTILENLPEGKILMLEPRRIAARQVASRMADMLGEKVGRTIGYRVRFDTKVSPLTRIEVITEGILERILIQDPTLEGVAVVIFDEYHERSLSSDLSLALTREIQNVLRPDLRIIIMSATIDSDLIASRLVAQQIQSPGKNYEVKIEYGRDYDIRECAAEVAGVVKKALHNHEGNILAFLPGQAEILKCREILSDRLENVEILTLYGMMPPADQQRVLSPSKDTKRRVFLASPIAETSLTIEGISVVIDSGLHRTPVFNPSTTLTQLETVRITMDMAVQRAGRAGRLMNGVCYRLWTKAAESRMKESRHPEIETSDLASMLLTVAAWGETDPLRLPWITPPAPGHVENAKKLLLALEAIDKSGRLTEKGKRIAALPCHPRIANMLAEADHTTSLACDIAALLEEKDPIKDETDADLTTRLATLHQFRKSRLSGVWKRIDSIASQYRRLTHASSPPRMLVHEEIGRLVGLAFPERIAMRAGNGQYRMAQGGNLVCLHPTDDLARHEFLAIASVGSRIYLAAPIDKEYVMSLGKWTETASWNAREGKAVAREELRLGSLILSTRPLKGDAGPRIIAAIAEAAPKEGLSMFDFNDDVEELQLRIQTASAWHPELALPDVSTEALLNSADSWLPMYIGKSTSAQEMKKINLTKVILGLLSYDQQQALERLAPSFILLPSGRRAKVRYRKGADAPVVSARLQDCFGILTTPMVDGGKRPVLMELLSPGFKPVQLTQDMEGFWQNTYHEVRKELRRRYPKHRWPEDPLSYASDT